MTILRYDNCNSRLEGTLLTDADFADLAPQIEDARREVLADLELFNSGQELPADKQPLDAAFIDLPERLLDAHQQQGPNSELGQMLATAERLAGEVEKVIVLGIGGSYMGSRAIQEACVHPYYNELARDARGNRPQVYHAGNNVDNDATAALLDLLRADPEQPWAIVVISKSGGTVETAAALRIFLAELEQATGHDAEQIARRVVPITGPQGHLANLATALSCPDRFLIPEGIGGRFSVLTAVGLLPAALMGVDVVALLEGAAAMNEHFRSAPQGENCVLDYTATSVLLEKKHDMTIRVLSTWGAELEATGFWYDQLLSESLGKDGTGATPITAVNTRDLHSRGQQHQQGRRDKSITNLIFEQANREPIAIASRPENEDDFNKYAGKTLQQMLQGALAGTNKAYALDSRPTANLVMPRRDPASLGQFFQMMMLATVTEGRLVGTNPYGQPGVEFYKRFMKENLEEN